MVSTPKISQNYLWLTKIAFNYLKTGKLTISTKDLDDCNMKYTWIPNQKEIEINRIWLDGARKSAKSLSLYVFFTIILLFAPLEKNTTIKVYAWYFKDAENCFEEFTKRAKDFGIDFSTHPYIRWVNRKNLTITFRWTYWDKKQKKNVEIHNEIQFKTCFEREKIKKLGIARSSDYHNEIIMFEEYSKINEESVVDFIRQAHGGSKKYLECFSSNPWSIKHFLVKIPHTLLPYNLDEIKKYHYQLLINEYGDIVWHCQWRVNNLINPPDVMKQEDIERNSPEKSKVACFGQPGIEMGGILTNWCNGITYINIKNDEELTQWDLKHPLEDGYYQFGMDAALKQDRSVLQLVKLIGMKSVEDEVMYEKVVIVKEWFWDPVAMGQDYSFMADDMAEYIFQDILMLREILPNFKKQLDYAQIQFFIDLSNANMISAMKKCILGKDNYRFSQNILVLESLRFNYKAIGNAKYYTKDMMKIQELRRLLEEDALSIIMFNGKSVCPLLEDNMLNWEYKKSIEGMEKSIPSDKNCDAIDAFIYSICDCYGVIGRFFQKN